MIEERTTRSVARSKPAISSIHIRNFKRIHSVDIELGDITYLVGGNNSGKSSVLQAIHTGFSCAQLSLERGNRKNPVKALPEADLLYSPTAHFSDLGHSSPYRGPSTPDKGTIQFVPPTSSNHPEQRYTITLYKPRNHNNAGVELQGPDPIASAIADKATLFSVYVPGLTGIPLYEEYKSLGAILRTAAGGEANLVFRNILLQLEKQNRLPELERLVTRVLGKKARFTIDFDDDRSLYIDVKLALGRTNAIPVDLWGTGVLQVTQMFAYALLFQPTLFLIDEPDSHLHPSLQQTLAQAFEAIAKELECRIIITTHSRHMISAAPEGTRVVWLKDGQVADPDAREVTEILLDLGALDTFDATAKMVFYTEDAKDSSLREALKETESITVLSYDGVKNAPQVSQMNELMRALDRDASIVIHRDRDCLTDEEIDKWSRPYREAGIHVFIPRRTDTESYYCLPQYVAAAVDISEIEARRDLRECLRQHDDQLWNKFDSKRMDANRQFWKSGGSPRSEDLWNAWNSDGSMRHVYGKDLFRFLKHHYRNNPKRDRLGKQSSPELVKELRAFLDQISEF